MKKEKIRVITFLSTLLLCSHFSFSQLHLLSDEFDNSSINSSWLLFNNQMFTTPVPINNGFMEINVDDNLCSPTCVWWKESNAGFIYKTVTGNFDVVTAVFTKQKSNPSLDIDNDTQLAGLMARDPASTSSGNENYVFNVTGVRFDTPSIELKSTSNNTSTINAYTDNMTTGTNAELRIVRENATFRMYSRPIGSTTWTLRNTYNRPDLPTTLQVGVIAYTFESFPGKLSARFDYIRYSDPNTLHIDSNLFLNTIKLYQVNSKTLKIDGLENERTSIVLYNLLGKRILSTYIQSKNQIEISLPEINTGIYILQLKTPKGNLHKKIHIKRG